jgi:cation-transporting ATPase E
MVLVWDLGGWFVCTYFNLVFLVLAVMLALVHSWLNMGFLGIVFWNTLIGIVQQLRAKRTIDKLTLVSAQKLRCLRDGRWCEVLSDDLVQDDVVEFGAGDQIAADAVVLDGSAQANESLITGEARAVPKECGAELKSGSFLMAGRCVARLTRVGAESYASRLTAEAQADGHRVARGEMMRSLDRLIKFIGVALIPIGAVLIWKQHWVLELSMQFMSRVSTLRRASRIMLTASATLVSRYSPSGIIPMSAATVASTVSFMERSSTQCCSRSRVSALAVM